MLLPLTDGLIRTTHFDGEMSMLADRHYSRRTIGARQFLYSGRKLVLRNSEGTVLFGWIWPDFHTNFLDDNVRFRGFHIHTATERYQKITDKVEHFAEITTRYADLDGAVECLLTDCGFRAPIEESPLFTGKIE